MLWPWLPFLLLLLQLLGSNFCTKLGGSLQQDERSSGHKMCVCEQQELERESAVKVGCVLRLQAAQNGKGANIVLTPAQKKGCLLRSLLTEARVAATLKRALFHKPQRHRQAVEHTKCNSCTCNAELTGRACSARLLYPCNAPAVCLCTSCCL
jgi:hypothetical protein